ncbi:Glycosyltransferase [Halalkaliarchaeum sp. AArc-CO]|uniref:glycosyltransferase family 4 protein n=1 Tax=Halalkaliarchaeum sp. AArc-CO TaxID=2866381 RepID=UPI00217F1608|nr:glycosyltransferase family 4 protein [Halalkaliarchaeum sp. AArc-CO]UWG51999.1 Glycosyltransferase [Halalkaliarchaeum sp. AArc-CO]
MSQSPHVCFVSDTIHTYFGSGVEQGVGGAERQQYLIAQRLRDESVPVSIVTLDYDEKPSPETIDDIEVWKEIPDKRGVLNAPLKTTSLLRALRAVDADVYYVRGNDFLCIVTALYCRLSDAKFVYAVANDSNVEPEHLRNKNPALAKSYLSAVRSADHVTVLTPHQREVLDREHGIDSTVVPCGYDLPPDEEVLDHDEREYVLWVGRLDRDQKRPERFLNLAESLPEVPFVMIGPPDNDDRDNSYFEQITSRAETIDNLEFIEFVPPNEIHEYFRKASIFVNTSAYEGFGNTFLEAWRYATPVVTVEYTLHGEITDREVGIQADSVEDLPDVVEDLYRDVRKRRTLGQNGRELVREQYSMKSVTDQYREIFSDL